MAHQHYKGTGQMHSFRGFLADGGQDRIRIEGATGEIAWRITKFEVIGGAPGVSSYETVLKIYREEQSSVTATIDFSDDELLASASYAHASSGDLGLVANSVIFDNALFVRNIYINNKATGTSLPMNYYIELEEVKVSAAGMAQLAVAAARRT